MSELDYVEPSKLLRKYIRSGWNALRHRDKFDEVEYYCMFLGYPRSGHSLTASLLTGHPEIVIAHEFDLLKYLGRGFSQRQLFALLLERDRSFTDRGRRWNNFDYQIPELWQGYASGMRIIGDKKGGGSSWQIYRDPGLLRKLDATITIPIKIIHQLRNPFDVIGSTTNRRTPMKLSVLVDHYFKTCDGVQIAKEYFKPEQMIDITYEGMVRNPRRTISDLCEFLGVSVEESYLDVVSSFVDEYPRESRNKLSWPRDIIDEVLERMKEYDFLAPYYESDLASTLPCNIENTTAAK